MCKVNISKLSLRHSKTSIMSKNSLAYNIKLKYYDNRETKLYAF